MQTDSEVKIEKVDAAEVPSSSLVMVPSEVLDLLRFMCATWTEIDLWAYKYASPDAIVKYPVIQGTQNQLKLQRIGEQPHNTKNINKAVEWLLSA